VNRDRLFSMMSKEFTQMRRDRHTLGMLMGIPVFQLLLFGFAIRQEVRNLPTVVYDASRTQQSRTLVQQFTATGNFRLRGYVPSYEAAQKKVDAGRARAAIVIPEGYARDLKRGRTTPVQVMVDASDPTAAQAAIGAAQLVGQRQSLEILRQRTPGAAGIGALPIDVRVRPLYNPALASALYIVPGIIGMILSNMLIMMTALSLVRERELGTMEQLIVTPLKATEFIIGKTIPFILIAQAQMVMVILFARLWFRIPMMGSAFVLLTASSIFLLSTLGIGLLISTVSRTQQQAMMTNFFFILPFFMLSGFVFPIANMPEAVQWLTYFNPLRYFLIIIRGIFLKGVGMTILWPQLAALAVMGLLILWLASRRFRKTLA